MQRVWAIGLGCYASQGAMSKLSCNRKLAAGRNAERYAGNRRDSERNAGAFSGGQAEWRKVKKDGRVMSPGGAKMLTPQIDGNDASKVC